MPSFKNFAINAASVATFAALLFGQATADMTNVKGTITYYGDDPTTSDISPKLKYGACMVPLDEVPDYFMAIASPHYDTDIKCRQCVLIEYENRFIVVQAVDECPTCTDNGLDIAHQAMGDLLGSYDRATEVGMFTAVYSTLDNCDLLGQSGSMDDYNSLVSGKSVTSDTVDTSDDSSDDDDSDATPTQTDVNVKAVQSQSVVTATPSQVRVCSRGTTPKIIYTDGNSKEARDAPVPSYKL